MQILEIVLYGRNGKKRVVSLRPGAVNIITGRSHTGKTALIPIVFYCLGGASFNVPEGRILDTVAWFGLLLDNRGTRVFVARENPYPTRASTSTAFLSLGVIGSPAHAPSEPNTNVEALEAELSRFLGISPNLNVAPEGSTRPALAANIRHSLFYCFQHQTEIANNQLLFHRQSGEYMPAAIRDTLPYFLGAIREDELALEEQLSIAKRRLRLLEIQQEEIDAIEGTGVAKARSFVREAIAVGVLPDQPLPDTRREVRKLWKPGAEAFGGSDQLSTLQQEVDVLRELRSKLNETIRAASVLSGEAQGFSDEARIQGERLESIGLFEDATAEHENCPLCTQHLETPIPSAATLRESLAELRQSLAATERERPRLREYIAERTREFEAITEQQAEKHNAIIALQNQEETARQIRDLNSRRAKVVGRISLYVETVPAEDSDNRLPHEIEHARKEVERLANQLDPVQKEQRLSSILNRIGLRMSELARVLDLEFSDSPVRFDLSTVTVVIDTDTRPRPLSRVGSGENWLGYHLVTHFAFHRHFRHDQRPVPAFLFLDQPTQVYFPADQDPDERDISNLGDEDREKVSRMFQLMFRVVKELAPEFQLIVTDHADLRGDPEFQAAVVEKWFEPGKALIPDDW
jgi:hypothetical protein